MNPYIFIHINKCAGTSVKRAIGWPYKHYQRYKHEALMCVRFRMTERQFAGAFKFAFVRHPLPRVVSMYHYRKRLRKLTVDFDAWVRKVFVDENPEYVVNPLMSKPCYDWISLNGEIAVDYIGKVETMDQDWPVICDKIGITSKLPVLNASTHHNHEKYYTKETRAIVMEAFKKDLVFYE